MKIDCSKTDNYFKEKIRMIVQTTGVTYCLNNSRCKRCLLYKENNPTGLSCSNFEFEHPDKAISVVQKWSDEHPQKTYKDDFFEKLPDAIRKKTDVLMLLLVEYTSNLMIKIVMDIVPIAGTR